MGKNKEKTSIIKRAYTYFEYLAVCAIGVFLRTAGIKNALRFGRWLGWLVSVLDPEHTRRTHRHLKMALGAELSEGELRKIARGVYSHFGMVLVEMFYVKKLLASGKFKDMVRFEGIENLDNALSSGKGVIMAGGHLGNWEVCGCYLAMNGYKVNSIARPLDNPYLDDILNRMRMQTGQNIFQKWGALKESIKALKKNEIVAMLVDQDARKYGVFVNFFGIPSSTLPTPATLALKYDAEIVPFYTLRVGNEFKYVLGFEKSLKIEKTGDMQKDVVSMTQEIASALERAIRKHPEQWLWVHRRWKTTPEKLERKRRMAAEAVAAALKTGVQE